jgi:hypothetical protein
MRKGFVALIAVLAFALLAGSCSAHVTGGGFIPDHYEEGTANFGFNFQCDGLTEGKGHITYHDASADLRVKGTVTHCTYGINKATAHGTYEGQGKSDYQEGTFEVLAIDNSEPGTDDVLHIWLDDVDEPDYHNVGPLLGGNIQNHDK